MSPWISYRCILLAACLCYADPSAPYPQESYSDMLKRYWPIQRGLKEKLGLLQRPGFPEDIKINLELDAATCEFSTSRPVYRNYYQAVSRDLYAMNHCLATWSNAASLASWNYQTNLTAANKKKVDEEMARIDELSKQLVRLAKAYLNDPKYGTLSKDFRRQLRFLAFQTTPLSQKDNMNLIEISSKLVNIYSSATVDGKPLDPDITAIIRDSRDPAELEKAWLGWRKATGPPMNDLYEELVRLQNIGARDNGFENYAEAWIQSQFDNTPNFESTVERLWAELEPLYKQLHAFVRSRLSKMYGKHYPKIFGSGAIPAHLLGNMWAQDWDNIYDLVKPYPDVSEPDYDSAMKDQSYTVDDLFQKAEEFYTSIGFEPMTERFNKYSMKVRPTDGREVVCHASAFDFLANDDYRIKMCGKVNMHSFQTIHHEMGHIEYYMSYRKQPTIYRAGANSGFHEAVGDTIALSVITPAHLRTIKLAGPSEEGVEELAKKRHINYLMKKGLLKIAFLPFGFLIDKWRWDVYRGAVDFDSYNKYWWYLRLKYQGILPPVARSDKDFDPGAKFHISSKSPYICYFVSFIIQFQFYEAMCKEAGHQGELSTCDFYRSRAAGDKLRSALELGKSKPWQDAMEKLTGVRHIDTASIIRYFKPLRQWLEVENARTGARIGWDEAKVDWIGN